MASLENKKPEDRGKNPYHLTHPRFVKALYSSLAYFELRELLMVYQNVCGKLDKDKEGSVRKGSNSRSLSA